ncbi:uncharacterized protein SPPG_09341 [Spizellomyces punctatus DAOM BR117]|uniref:Uncharacterized protein n=1 Tax=Spizellomyces punctatus (strain DAOM BR117) TaxID=645134 RepID=A0A0L0HD96_SPIPD|nr:uncharacterized protein SPPG_09341 [Spizellomyces punctatus DAOM BR117]KNC99087.1 hypothetical protein SPPG_09341 [Spizellomyces punctatus DAOM BR117]|eukprot:XP_016607127.1 hypothetical protein SPPG_09341 [Spizellomyces punctatus DAOM BR117]
MHLMCEIFSAVLVRLSAFRLNVVWSLQRSLQPIVVLNWPGALILFAKGCVILQTKPVRQVLYEPIDPIDGKTQTTHWRNVISTIHLVDLHIFQLVHVYSESGQWLALQG